MKRQAPRWWSEHKTKIWNIQRQEQLERQLKYEKKVLESGKEQSTWKQYQYKQNQIELARLIQNTKSASELMRLNNDRTEMILTWTISQPFRVADTDKSFDSVMQRIRTQVKSLLHHMRTLSKSEVFASDETKECAYKKRLHYHWALELQTGGDVHMHIVVSIYDDIEELAKLVKLVHDMRNAYLDVNISERAKSRDEEIFPLGRTHFALSAHLKDGLLEHYRLNNVAITTMPDKEDPTRTNYFLPSLSPKIDIYSGRATLLEFNDNATMAEKYDHIRKYIISMTRAKFKLRTAQTAISDAQRTHNIKGKFEGDESRAAEDVAVFEFLGLKLHSSSQMLFSKSFYQKIRKQLIAFKSRYKSLAQVTVDWCAGNLVIDGREPDRVVTYRGQVVSVEPKRKKVDYSDYMNVSENEYALAKEGI